MKWKVKLGEDCDRLLKNHDLDELMSAAQEVVAHFMEQHPTVLINEGTLVIHKDATVELRATAAEATPADNVKIEIKSEEE